MNQEIKQKWLEALRSGEYKQGQSALRENDRFCCLGVLCNLHAEAHPEFAAKQKNSSEYDGQLGHLPVSVQKWSGLTSSDGHIEELPFRVRASAATGDEREVFRRGSFTSLTSMNDEGCNFRQIADVIEAAF